MQDPDHRPADAGPDDDGGDSGGDNGGDATAGAIDSTGDAAITALGAPGAAAAAVDARVDGAAPMTPAECAQRLATLFPALFGGAPKPLKLRVHADIQSRAPGVFPKAVLSAFMRRHTGSTAYLNAVARGTQRYGLDGEAAGDIAPEHRQGAVDELARRRARLAEQREREARERQAAGAERRQRAALLRDFERTTLTVANFCALKRLSPEQLEAQLALARREAAERPPPLHPPRARPPRRDARPGGAPRRRGGRLPPR